ncbi:hypothetical protein HFN89_07115 [Rhizobium laguerreae]|nr:hypothetical protein [Rhizobium laguerreae]
MTELAFDIPYIFKVNGVPKRGTKERTEFAFETIPATVRVIDPGDAPVAAVFDTPFGSHTYIGENGQVTLRAYYGRIYAKALTEYSHATLGVTPDMLSTFLDRGIYAVENSECLRKVLPDAPGTIQRGLFPEDEVGNNPIRPFKEEKWQSWKSSDRNENRAKAERLYGNLIVIDGMFWRAVPEPVYLLDRHIEPAAVIMPLWEAEKKGSNAHIFGLADWDRMVATSLRLWGSEPDSKRATIFVDEAFSYDNTTEIFIGLMAKATDYDGDLLKSFDVESMCRWAAMRDALALARTSAFTPATLDALAAAAEHYVCGPNSSEHARGLVAKALEIHDGRAVDVPVSYGRSP